MEIGNKEAKYAIHVNTETFASKYAGTIYCNTAEEYKELLEENFDQLHDSGYFSTNISNDFEVGDIELSEFDFDEDSKYYKNI